MPLVSEVEELKALSIVAAFNQFGAPISQQDTPEHWIAASKIRVIHAVENSVDWSNDDKNVGIHLVQNTRIYRVRRWHLHLACVAITKLYYVQHLLLYTYTHVRFCAKNERYSHSVPLCISGNQRTFRRLLAGLLELIEAWKRWDDLAILLNHREIKDFLWMCLLTGSNVSFTLSYETHYRTNARLLIAGNSFMPRRRNY